MQKTIGSKTSVLNVDAELRLRFFTSTAAKLFKIGADRVGRHLSELSAVFPDDDLVSVVQRVLRNSQPNECEIFSAEGAWFLRSVQPYLSDAGQLVGAVITYVDISDHKGMHTALIAATNEARQASQANSRFLVHACHDLRQPLQSIALVHQILSRQSATAQMEKLLGLMSHSLSTMTAILDQMLDANWIESGAVQPNFASVGVAPIIQKLADEIGPACDFKGLSLRLMPCNYWIRTDPILLEQILRNLMANTIKYTSKGGILLGCRQRGRLLDILVCGIGAEAADISGIFDAYHQTVRKQDLAKHDIGFGLSIVQRLGKLLDHPISMRSNFGKGSSFMLTVPIVEEHKTDLAPPVVGRARPAEAEHTSSVLVVDDDEVVRELLADILEGEGYTAIVKKDASEAIAWAVKTMAAPDIVLSGYNLRGEWTGPKLAEELASIIGESSPVLILTGDITSRTAEAINAANFRRIVKPVDAPDLLAQVAEMIASARAIKARSTFASDVSTPTLHVIDDDPTILHIMRHLFEAEGFMVSTYSSAEEFLDAPRPTGSTCLLVDDNLPGMNGSVLINHLRTENLRFGAIVLTGHGDAAKAVAAMKAGASDFLEKPADAVELITSVRAAIDGASADSEQWHRRKVALARLSDLTDRERDILERVLEGLSNKIIAAELGINQRTVENHRASVMRKTQAASLPDLVRLVISAQPAGVSSM